MIKSKNWKMNIVIVGLGVIGGVRISECTGIDTNESTLDKAKLMGLIKDGSVKGELFLK